MTRKLSRDFEDLLDGQIEPPHLERACVKGPEVATIELPLQTCTVLYGGGALSRNVDHYTPVRPSIVRAMLRFWWRALFGHRYSTPRELMAAEKQLWGGANDGQHEGRSPVEVHINNIHHPGGVDRSNVGWTHPAAYALWPARETSRDGIPPAERWPSGLSFALKLRAPKENLPEVKQALKAWLLFGGIGSRTRRGCGSVTISDPKQRAEWLPKQATLSAIDACLGESGSFQEEPTLTRRDVPLLKGASLCVGQSQKDAGVCWETSLNWLKDFRQGQPRNSTRSPERFARERGDNRRPGRSNWPESDKVRQLSGRGPWAHAPRHNRIPVWPRASFGLPINGQFQSRDRSGNRYSKHEPRPFELQWRDSKGKSRSRLASPLILKPMPLANGEFVPIALWLYRAFPEGGEVGLRSSDKHGVDKRAEASYAPFDDLVASGDEALFAPLDAHQDEPPHTRMREAFFQWLDTRVQRIA